MNPKLTRMVASLVLISFLAVFLISFLTPYTAGATSQQELQNKIDQAEAEKKSVLSQKSDLEKQIAKVQGEIDVIQGEIDELSSQINQKQAEIEEAEIKAQEQYELMKIRLRTMYEDNSTSYITLLFSGESLSDIVSYAELIKQVLSHDNNMYDDIIATKELIEESKKEIEEKRTEEESKKSVVEEKKAELQSENDKLAQTASKLTNDIAAFRKAYEEAEEIQRRAREEAARRANQLGGAVTYTGGKLQWPSPGYTTVTSPYGWRLHPVLGVNKFHSGIDIAVPMGAPIVAAEAGTVVTSSYDKGYGNYVVISHGGGMTTLYAHNSKVLVSVGQQVSRGQQIAACGSTGMSTGPHCHFEVLKNGATTNPLSYY